LQEAYVIPVNVNVHESSDFSRFITNPLLDSGKFPLKIVYQGLDGITLDIYFIGSLGEFSEWGRHPDTHAHNLSSLKIH
jgi:hypothetical protein